MPIVGVFSFVKIVCVCCKEFSLENMWKIKIIAHSHSYRSESRPVISTRHVRTAFGFSTHFCSHWGVEFGSICSHCVTVQVVKPAQQSQGPCAAVDLVSDSTALGLPFSVSCVLVPQKYLCTLFWVFPWHKFLKMKLLSERQAGFTFSYIFAFQKISICRIPIASQCGHYCHLFMLPR